VIGVKLAGGELDGIFRGLNKSGSGKIDFSEFWAWWTSSTSQGATSNEIRNRLLIARGKSFLTKAFNDKVKRQVSEGATKIIVCNPVTEPKMGITIEMSNTKRPLAAAMGANPDADVIIAFDFDLASVESKPYAEALIQVVALAAESNLSAGMTVSVVDGDSEGTLRLLIVGTGDVARETSEHLDSLNLNFTASIQAGWSFGSLGASQFSASILDLLNFEVSATLDTLPLDVKGGIDSALAALRSAGLPVDELENAPGMAELNSGNTHTTVDFTEAIISLLGTFGEMSPIPVDGETSISGVVSGFAPMLIMGQSPIVRRRALQNLRVAAQAAQAFRMYLSRDIRGLSSLHVQTRGGFGCTASFLGLFSTEAVGQVVTGAVALGTSIAESIPAPTDEEIAEWELQQEENAQRSFDGEGDEAFGGDAEDVPAGDDFNYDD